MDSLKRTEIEVECMRLCNAFFYHIDHEDFEPLIQLFAPDGVFHRHSSTLRGHDEMRAAYANRPRVIARHLCGNLFPLELTETYVRSVLLVIVIHSFETDEPPVAYDLAANPRVMEFFHEFRPVDGRWRIASLSTKEILVPAQWKAQAFAERSGGIRAT